MKTIKPQKLGVLCKSYEDGGVCHFVATILVFFPFDDPQTLIPEVNLWKFAGEQLPPPGVIDDCMPKKHGEYLVTGAAYPRGYPHVRVPVRVTVGAMQKELIVSGDRYWLPDGKPSAPQSFEKMPIVYEHAFGGAGYEFNPVGRGVAPVDVAGRQMQPLPNVEDPARPVRSPEDRPPPAGLGPFDVTWLQRASKLGTYDERWLRERFPGYAEDIDWTVFNAAPPDQWLPEYFAGGEPFAFENMHPDKPTVTGTLPTLRARAFINQKTAEGEVFREIPMRLETVRLFPHVERGVLVFRGVTRVAEDDGADVLQFIAAGEAPDAPRPIEHYQTVLAQRLDRARAVLYALRDEDLLPPPSPRAPHPAESFTDMMDHVRTENLLVANQTRRAERAYDAAAARARAAGLDPEKVLPPRPRQAPVPTLAEIPAIVQTLEAEAAKSRVAAAQQKEQAHAAMRRVADARGISYEQLLEEQRRNQSGPPKFTAEREIRRLRGLADEARRAGTPVPALEARIASPRFRMQLEQTEEAQRETYRRSAHHQPAAQPMDPEAAANVRARMERTTKSNRRFVRADLTGADLTDLDLRHADFTEAYLEGARFSDSDIDGANFTNAVLAHADFSRTRLQGCRLAGANLGGAKFAKAYVADSDLTGAILAGADLTDTNFATSTLERVDFSNTVFAGTTFSGARVTKAFFYRADLKGMNLAGAILSQSNFIECDLEGVDFSGADLTRAVFVTARAARTLFRRAIMTNVRFVKDSNLAGATFLDARLERALLRGTDLTGCNFSQAQLESADLSECTLRGAVFYRAVARNAQFVRADLTGARMTSIDLAQGSLQKAVLRGADFLGANLFRADLAFIRTDERTNFQEANRDEARVTGPRPPRP